MTALDPALAVGEGRLDRWVEEVWCEAVGMRRVLLAVTDEALRAACRTPLLEAGWLVSESDSASLAVELAWWSPPDAAVFDLRTHTADGWGALRRLRGEPRTAATPVVGVVRRAGESELWYARRQGVEVLLRAASARERVRAAVEAALEAQRVFT